jgi:hypothetical protein
VAVHPIVGAGDRCLVHRPPGPFGW